MTNAITRKLHRFAPLDADDAQALGELLIDTRTYPPHSSIMKIGAKPGYSLVIVRGWAISYKVVRDGSRQITAFLLPGDFCHLNIASEVPLDYSIGTLSCVTAAHVRHDEAVRLFARNPNIKRAVQTSQLDDESRLRALITTLGRKDAVPRVGYALCDLWARAKAIGLMENGSLDFPPTQADIADHVGLTPVHVNRMMRCLRKDGLLELTGRQLLLPDFERLARTAEYNQSLTGINRHYEDRASSGRTVVQQQAANSM